MSGRNQLYIATFSCNHSLKELLEKRFAPLLSQYCFSLESITAKQQTAIKSSTVDINNHLNENFPSFDSLNREIHLGNRLVNSFSDCFSFYKANYSSEESKSHYYSCLDNIVFTTSFKLFIVVVISDASIKNNIVMFITHTYSFNNSLIKILHHAINVTIMEVELFAIRCGINQATWISGTSCIIIIMNTITNKILTGCDTGAE